MTRAGDRGLDHAGRPADYSRWAAAARSAGFRLDLRYLCRPETRPINVTKLARRDELAAARAEGLDIALVWQDAKTDAQGGAEAGRRNGAEAGRLAAELGYPHGRVIFAAVDYDVTSGAAFGVVAAYLDGFARELGPWLPGVYGEADVIDAMVPAHVAQGWQATAWSGGRVSGRAHLIQRREQPTIDGVLCDANDILRDDLATWPSEETPMPDIVTRAEWGARAPTSTKHVAPSTRTHFFVHYSTGEELGRPDPAEWVREIQRYHMDSNRWADIGYNWLVDVAGRIYEGRGWNNVGAHCPDFNTVGIGVCFLGDDDPGYDDSTPEARAAIRWLAEEADRRSGKALTRVGHRDHRQTACPGDELHGWVHSGMPLVAAPAPPPPVPSPTLDFSEDAMRSKLLGPLTLDANGNGWTRWAPDLRDNTGVVRAPIPVAATIHGPYPPSDGYWYAAAQPVAAMQVRGNEVIVSVSGGKPGGALNVFATVA